MRTLNFRILWRQDWFVVEKLQQFGREPHLFLDRTRYMSLILAGQKAQSDDDIDRLRDIVAELYSFRIDAGPTEDSGQVNIVRG
jgi:molecular chaperone DnaK